MDKIIVLIKSKISWIKTQEEADQFLKAFEEVLNG